MSQSASLRKEMNTLRREKKEEEREAFPGPIHSRHVNASRKHVINFSL